MYSKLTIKILTPFELGSKVAIKVKKLGSYVSNEWVWVASRASSLEVTTAGNIADTTTNFHTAIDADVISGDYNVTKIGTDTIEIEALSSNITFISYRFLDGLEEHYVQGTDYEINVNNYNPTFDVTTLPLMLIKSPHYINVPFYNETTTAAQLRIKIWSGDLSAEPTGSVYQLTIPRPSIDFEEFNVNISDLIDESLLAKPIIDLTNPNSVVDVCDNCVRWVKYAISYIDDSYTTIGSQKYLIATEGYGYYNEGANPKEPNSGVLSSCKKRKVARSGMIVLPFLNNGKVNKVEVRGYPASVNMIDYVVTPINNSNKIVQYVQLKGSAYPNAEYVEMKFLPSNEIYVFELIDECRYNPIQVLFKNKYGQFDTLTLFKKSSKSISVENDDFVNNYIKNGVYSTTTHQHKKINITAKESIKVSSGYIGEEENELYKQLLISDGVYFYENEKLIPVNIKTSGLEYKTRVNDKLVNYELEFDYAYNVIQNV